MASKSALRYAIFSQEYVIDLNATRAALAAGYSESNSAQIGSALLKNPKVSKLITTLLSQRASKSGVKAEKVVEELARMAFSNMADYMEIDEHGKPKGLDLSRLTRDQAAAILEITEDTTGGSGDGERRLVLRTKFKLADKGRALELLGRHLGMFQDNVKITGLEGLAERLAEIRTRRSGDSRS